MARQTRLISTRFYGVKTAHFNGKKTVKNGSYFLKKSKLVGVTVFKLAFFQKNKFFF
jgi:hypothetical protein